MNLFDYSYSCPTYLIVLTTSKIIRISQLFIDNYRVRIRVQQGNTALQKLLTAIQQNVCESLYYKWFLKIEVEIVNFED